MTSITAKGLLNKDICHTDLFTFPWDIYVTYDFFQFSFSPYYVVDVDNEIPRVIWQPTTECYVPPRVGQGDRRVKYTGDENPDKMSPKSRDNFFTALRMRRRALRLEAKEHE